MSTFRNNAPEAEENAEASDSLVRNASVIFARELRNLTKNLQTSEIILRQLFIYSEHGFFGESGERSKLNNGFEEEK